MNEATQSPRPGRRLKTIEATLRWAFAEELVNLQRRAEDGWMPSAHPMFSMRIDGGKGDWDADAVARLVDPDALAIGAAVARLREELIEPPDHLDDAERSLFIAQRGRAETLVVAHARLGDRPTVEIPEAYPLRASNGRPAVRRMVQAPERILDGSEVVMPREEIVASKVRERGQYQTGAYCVLEWIPSLDMAARDRAEYFVWRAALDSLVADLHGLSKIEVQPATAPWRPWD